jgi:hypothetical protein
MFHETLIVAIIVFKASFHDNAMKAPYDDKCHQCVYLLKSCTVVVLYCLPISKSVGYCL